MNSYRIDTFEMDDGTWKVAVYECGRYIGQTTSARLPYALELAAELIAEDFFSNG